ncbi:MAG: 2-dehydro-3-deoxygalactonokinase [Rhodoferax sp.]|uniref:2-dehydro-3-deoxygalactonokinase n=1 Tax=Thiobacillus denitrificans TaxID=36861 RepID=A0A106BDU0_THIDE|nr:MULTISPECIES: 2-dehydro-3-deoxygalactonokinase [Betaproteobacteria]KVW90372.1 2-dehydro-3-deoxygalactonokinase [Thiobacillus denitrificans]MDP2257553.1 2-dehydro-3-deoxygalactonokinase [Polaromonas sp.]MDP3617324.1 2-dehydro-3-deoxygalactonokinase [Rhodoferax sp.]
MNVRTLLAVDWGTSSLRGAWLDARGQAVEERSFARGILTVAPGEFAPAFESCFGDWMQRPDALCLMSGMVGSKQGWLEAPYCTCPAGFEEVAANLAWVKPGRVAIVPGLVCEHDGLPDVMRGEETQVFGALQLLGLQDALLVLPGTHSKWVRVQAGRIQSFATFMTGEFFALLRQHSILSRTLPASDGAFDSEAFDQGVTLALRGNSLLHTAFSTRTLSLFDRLPAAALPSYLSGLVIGEELRAQTLQANTHVVIIGSAALTQRYQNALALRGVPAQRIGSEATWAGLWAIAQTIHPSLLKTV